MKSTLIHSGLRLLSVVYLLLFVCLVIPGYSASISGKTYTSSNYTITSFVADHNYLWAGTVDEGLIRIDKNTGETVLILSTNSDLPDNDIRGLAVDTSGALIVGTSIAGVVRFDGKKWEKITCVNDNNVRSVATDNRGNIWVWWQSSGVMRFTAGAWQPVVNRFSGIMSSCTSGDVWIYKAALNPASDCNDGWIQEYVNGGLNTTRMLGSFCSEIENPSCMVVDNKRNCWMSGSRSLIKSTDATLKRFDIKNDSNEFNSITALAVNHNDVLLIAVSDYVKNTQIYLYDQKIRSEPSFDTCTFSVDDKSINAACFDKETGGFWCIASGGKIFKIDQFNKISVFKNGVSDLPGNAVASLLNDKAGNVWVAVKGGIARYDKNKNWNTFPVAGDTFPGRDVSSLALDTSGKVWAGFQQAPQMSSIQSGIASFNGDHWSKISTTHFAVKCVAFDNNNDLWIVSQDGVSRTTGNVNKIVFETKYSSDMHIALGTTVNTITFDKKNTPWIGTGLGIKRYENSVWVDDTTLSSYYPQTSTPIPGANIYCIHFDKDTTWIGTSRGLYKRFGTTCLRYDTTGSMLPDMNVQCLTIDNQYGVLAGTRGGLVQLTGNKHMIYTTNNTPLIDNDITACLVSPEGNIWIGTRLGGVTVMERSSVIEHIGTVTTTQDKQFRNALKKACTISVMQQTKRMYIVSIQTENPSTIQFDLYTIQGKLIRSFHGNSSGREEVRFGWDGTDRFNHIVASGLYKGVVVLSGRVAGRVTITR